MSLAGNTSIFKWFSSFTRENANFRQSFWKWWYNYLAKKYAKVDEWTCMNYGYLASPFHGNPKLEFTSKMLYEKACAEVELEGKSVVEIGCGRGGGLNYLHEQRKLGSAIGVDLSEHNITFCQRRFNRSGLSYLVGSADDMPLADASADVVINVESSHIYPDFPKFIQEAIRVLKPGGTFCFTDFRSSELFPPILEAVKKSGFQILVHEDISKNVRYGLDADAKNRLDLIQKHIPSWLTSPVSQFAGVPGSKFYNDLKSGETVYFLIQARKPWW